ncbi:unnamed protein product [Schistocephalus solidus]|uniref:Integrase catalytic domain-containing protein n=1 Tax=Schistocephalus solidus TaxID=70667 RepID=A0A183TIT2_SCHSO|nr:unnamed protein product [Schistocephalus solidus]
MTTGNSTTLCDVCTTSHRPYVPPSQRCRVSSYLNKLYNPGSCATDKVIFVWPGMPKDLKAWTRIGLGCQHNGTTKLSSAPSPAPMQCSVTSTSTLCAPRCSDAIPLPDVTASMVVKAFLSFWVATFCAPSTIPTDRGAQFESNLFQSLLSFLDSTRIHTTVSTLHIRFLMTEEFPRPEHR